MKKPHQRIVLIFMALFLTLMPLSWGIDLESLPQKQTLLLGSIPVRVAPKDEVSLTALTTGLLKLKTNPNQSMVAANSVIAEIDSELIELENEVLRLTEKLLEQKELKELMLQVDQASTQLETSLSKARSDLNLIKKIKSNPEYAEAFALDTSSEHPQDDNEQDTAETLAIHLKARIELIESFLETLKSPEYLQLETDLRVAQFSQQKLTFQKRIEASVIKMPFDGEIRYLIPTDNVVRRVRSGQDIAVALDFSEIYAYVPISNPDWRFLDPRKLELYLGQTENSIIANYKEQRIKVINNREELVYIFKIAKVSEENARKYLGGTITSRLFLRLDETCAIAPKLSLILEDKETFRQKGWPGLIESLFPGRLLKGMGQSEVAISNH